MADPKPGDGNAARLKRWWAYEEGRKRWYGTPHPFTTLRNQLRKHGVPEHMVDGLTANIFKMAYGYAPSERKRDD
ncbi:hypothetical protein O4547_25990 [Rhodococcus ruber]|uniref:Uncharacterized protein n=1 Tax=Rhodococcus ruber TaxID=1830 RepID=A0A098BJV1_9NOCA|nr:hypothetical protein [Rhodococcus ruber]MCZ4533460.1 hypothetical protein [Rhodococcus ruber]CDZ89034.1 hypothetical protein RHRU231_450201 [Rhodococcus ruber]